MLAAFKVPNSFIGYEEEVNGKATLAAQDVRFARTIERIQRILVSELTKIAIVHLYSQGFRDAKLVEFELALTNPSTIYEQEKIALWKDKNLLATELYQSKFMSRRWIYENILEMSSKEQEDIQEELEGDVEFVAGLQGKEQQIIMQASQPPAPPGGAQPAPGGEQPLLPAAGDAPEEPVANPDDPDMAELEKILDEPSVTEANKVGRPVERNLFNTDRHPAGRDPFGKKINRKSMQLDKSSSRRGRLGELVETLSKSRLANSHRPEEKTDFLHESNIMDDGEGNKLI